MKLIKDYWKIILILLAFAGLILLAASCLPARLADRIEESHWALYSHTKALKVTAVKDNFVLLESFSNPLRTYELRCDTLAVGDTLVLTDELRSKLKIKKVK